MTRPGLGEKFRITHKNYNGGAVFQAVHIPVQPSTNPLAFDLHTLPSEGADIMITTQLTGCSLVMAAEGEGTWHLAHIQPKGADGNDGTKLQNRLEDAGYNVFGKKDVPKRAAVIGVRKQSTWRFYAQLQDGDNVVSVEDITPAS